MPQVCIKVVRAELGPSANVKTSYVSVTFKGQTKRTQLKNGINPRWNEILAFELKQTPAASDEIKFELFDDDGFLGIDTLFGKAILSYNGLRLSTEKALDLKMKKGISIPGAKMVVSNADQSKKQGSDDKNSKQDSSSKKENGDKSPDVDEGIAVSGGHEGNDKADSQTGRVDRSILSEKPEDFQIRVKILSGRQLSGNNIKPVVKVKAGKAQAKNTRIRKGSSPIWNELMMFNFHESLKELFDFVFEFSVNNSRKMRSDALIGSFKLDLGTVYDQPEHAYVRKWLLLTDLEDKSNTPKGYLKISICVLGAGDQPPEDKADADDDDVEGNLLTPAGAALRSANFTLRVYNAEDLPQMDTSAFKRVKKIIGMGDEADITKSLVDPYLIFTFAGKKEKTRYIESRNDPEWNEELNLPIKFPSMCDAIKLTIKDWDRVGSDDPIGSVVIPMSRISSTGEDSGGADMDEDDFYDLEGFLPTYGPTYINFYGSPREFTELSDSLTALNVGKGDGCAFRGRAMVELTTTLDEEGSDPVPANQPIAEDQIALTQKYLRRRRYRLVVGFVSANLIDKCYENLEFEVSMGNYGNKFEADVGAACSVTAPTNPVFDGCKYYFMPWASKKPVMMVTSQWEDINFRLHGVNFILRLCDRMDIEVRKVRHVMDNNGTEVEIASEIVGLLDTLILETSKRIPDPRGLPAANHLDVRIHQQRVKTFKSICDEAKDLRQNCTDPTLALSSIHDFLDRLKSISYEPQNSLPDVIIWMISGNKRIAYYRIPAYDILHCHERPEFSGRFCSKPLNISLKLPTAKATSKKRYKIPCQARIIAWLGLAKEQNDFNFHSRGQISVYADTYEMENKIPIRGWVSDGYKDVSGEIPLPKESFSCPKGWEWDGDWEVSTEFNLLRDAGLSSYLEECFEYEQRYQATDWQPEKVMNSAGEEINGALSIQCPKGWEWEDEWCVDTRRACDEDGWEYTLPIDGQGELAWSSVERPFHIMRRRRLVRNRKNVDPKQLKKDEKVEQLMGEGWEYAATSISQFHPTPKILDLVRRRKWVCKMVTSGTEGSAAIFNLETSFGGGKLNLIPTSPSTPSLTEASKTKSILTLSSGDGGSSDKEDESLKKKSKKKGKSDSISSAAAEDRKKKKKMPAPKIYIMYSTPSKLQLRAYIYQGRDLLPMDQDNFSDPVVFVSFLNQCRRTAVIRHTLNPVWDQTLMMDIAFYGDLRLLQKYCNDVVLEIFDKDDVILAKHTQHQITKLTRSVQAATGLKKSSMRKKSSKTPLKPKKAKEKSHMGNIEFMGRTTGRPVLKFDSHDDYRARLKWHDVKRGEQNGGSVLAAFELYLRHEKQEMPLPPPRRKDLHMVPYGIRPVLQKTALEFLIWGVRNMQSFQLLAVDTPSVLVQVGDVEIKTKIIKSLKKNPNFSQPLYFATANLPVEQLYFPPIIIRVKDNRKFGRRPTVGQHVITNITKYRIEPIKRPVEQLDEGYDEPDGSPNEEVKETAIEIQAPEEKKKSQVGMFDKFKAEPLKKDEVDWWSKYYASIGEHSKCGDYADMGLDLIKIYKNVLEKQENFNRFCDFIETYPLTRGKAEDDEEPEFAGEFKGAFKIYELPADPNAEMPLRFFEKLPSTDPVELKVRVYVVRGYDLAPQDSNGLADPYLKIKAGKKRINDRENHIANSLEPTFGRMFELDVKIPMEKDLHVQVFDWDLIGTDDKIGETVIDLENRYLTKFRAWCGLPETYNTSGPTPWRDQMTPKDWLYDKARREGWDEPVWNSNTCVMVNRKTFRLSDYESNKKPSAYWGEPEQRLSLHILKSYPFVSEHVETRPLFSDVLPGIEQGRLHMWIDLFPKEYGDPGEPFNISPRKPSKYFLRVIIWNCSNIPMMDTSLLGDKMTDIYFKGWLTGLEHKKHKTDVHYRSLDGTGMYNWRFVFPFNYLPQEKLLYVSKKDHLWSLEKTVSKFPPVLNIQAWDNDLFKPNEYISEISLPLNKMPKCSKFRRLCSLDNIPDNQGNCRMGMISMFDQRLLKGWWPLFKMVDGKKVLAGKVEMSVEVVTEEEHEERPSGQGRDEPNMNPKLDKPKRPATSFAWFSSPLKSLRYIIWKKYKWIILGLLALLLLIAFVVLFLYSFPGLVSQELTGIGV